MGKEIWEIDTVAGDNDFSPSDGGWPEAMARSNVNNAARENLATMRRHYNDSEWIRVTSRGPDGAPADVATFARITANQVTVTFTPGVDITSYFGVGRVIKIVNGGATGTGSDLITQVDSRSYAGPINTVNILASDTIHANATDVYVHSNSVIRAGALVASSGNFYVPATADSAGINAAISLADAAGGGTVLLVAHSYAINNAGGVIDLTTKGNIILQGADPEVRLTQASDQNMNALITIGNPGPGEANTVKDVFIDVDRANNPTGNGYGIEIDGATRTAIERVFINNAAIGIKITSTAIGEILINKCRIQNYRSFGISSTAVTDTQRGIISGCYFDGGAVTVADPAAMKLAGKWNIDGNTIRSVGHASLLARGIWMWPMDAVGTGGLESVISNNMVEGSAAANGVCIEIGGSGVSCNGNLIESPTSGKGIYLNSSVAGRYAVGCVISGNSISSGSPIVANIRSRDTVISDNRCEPSSGLIGIESDGEYPVISGNNIRNGATGITTTANSLGSLVDGNLVLNTTTSGIDLTGMCNDIIVSNNVLTTTGIGIIIAAAAEDVAITANTVRGAATGLSIAAGALRTIVTTNTFSASTAITDAGTSTNRLNNSFDKMAIAEYGLVTPDSAGDVDDSRVTGKDMPCGGKAGRYLFQCSVLAGPSNLSQDDAQVKFFVGPDGDTGDTEASVSTFGNWPSGPGEYLGFGLTHEFVATNTVVKWGVVHGVSREGNQQVQNASVVKIGLE